MNLFINNWLLKKIYIIFYFILFIKIFEIYIFIIRYLILYLKNIIIKYKY